MKAWAALLALCCAVPAHAIDRIRLRATSIAATEAQLHGVDATLHLRGGDRSTVEVNAARAALPPAIEARTGALSALRLQCSDPVMRHPVFECPAFSVQVESPRWPGIRAAGRASFHADSGVWSIIGDGMRIAGAPLDFALAGESGSLRARLGLRGLQVTQVKELLLSHQLPVPDMEYSGQGNLLAEVSRQPDRTTAIVQLTLQEAGFQNADSTVIGERLAIGAKATVELGTMPITFHAQVTGSGGEALAGPVLLDFGRNPLELTLAGSYGPQSLRIDSLRAEQRNLATVSGSATIDISPFKVAQASIQAGDIRFPAAYASYLQIALSTSPFNQLTTTGSADLRVEVRDNRPMQLELRVRNVALEDASRSLKVEGVNSELHWSAGLVGPPRPSWLSWDSSTGWGIVGARSRLDFVTQDRSLRVTRPARLPFFDGALLVNTLAVENIGTEALNGVFDAVVEPISMAPIARALGLPEFAGKLSGRLPGLTYQDKLLSLQGNLEADVFDGRVLASNLRVRDPLGAWPRLYADITARNLDLQLVTSTFEFGSITGRLDVDIAGLETFNWSPVAMDLKLGTPPGDRSRHRISQRAVQNLSDIGGGGGGVAAALQSGFLRFFEEFSYDRIGLSCRLRNDICQMGGVAPAGTGFYIVKGRGLPRIDIIGNNALVDWPRLVSQVRDAMRNPEGIELR